MGIYNSGIDKESMLKYAPFLRQTRKMTLTRILLLLLIATVLSSCGSIINSQVTKFTDSLNRTVLNFEDPETVAQAVPTLLILSENFASSDDASAESQLSASRLYGAYSGAFVTEPKRQAKLSKKSFKYAISGACKTDKKWCGLSQFDSEQFDALISKLNEKDVEISYAVGVAWLGYIQTHSNDWAIVAGMPKAKALLEQVVKYDETYDNAGAHLYLGALASSIPPALGGKPEQAKAHFERAIDLTDGKNLLVKVEYARRYARSTFDKELHHKLLQEVLSSNPNIEGLALMNNWAMGQATQLLADENDYFD